VLLLTKPCAFFSNKYDNIQHNDLKTILVSFYRDEELFTARDLLAKAAQQCFRDIGAEAYMPRLPKRQGDNKIKQTVDDILKLFTLMDERKLRETLPVFVAGDLTRIPFVSNDGFSMVSLARRVEAMEQRLVVMEGRAAISPAEGNRDGVAEAAGMEDQHESVRRPALQPTTADSDLQSGSADDDSAL